MHSSFEHRIAAALGAGVLTLLLAYALSAAFGLARRAPPTGAIQLVDLIAPPPSPEPRPVPRKTASKRQGAASPPNLRSTATQIVAPPPVIPLPIPPPVAAAPVANSGADRSQGAADVPGPGTGAGGVGTGTGSGGRGYGDGYGEDTPPRLIRGRLKDSDYPRAAAEAGAGGLVGVRFTVATNGRAIDCRVTRSSGNAELDAETCRLIQQRYRFEPSRDPDGTPIPSTVIENHEWMIREEPPERR